MKQWIALTAVGASLLASGLRASAQPSPRTLTVATTEVTAPALAVSPDEQTLVFSALGHLHQMPASGGATTQLTFGPAYDTDPAFSPDGRRLAFASNRSGGRTNIFVLDLRTKQLQQVTSEVDAGRPAWSPDGRSIAYARALAREDHPFEFLPGFADTGLRELRTVPAEGGAAAAIGPPRNIETVFYLPDGRLAWSVRDIGPGGSMFQTTSRSRIETMGPSGTVSVLARADGEIGRVALGHSGDGVYYAARGGVQWLPFAEAQASVRLPRIQDAGTRLAVAPRGQFLFFNDRGSLWRVAAGTTDPQPIAFSASIAVDVWPKVVRPWQPPIAAAGAAAVRAVLAPRLSPDGTRVAVIGGGFLWEQSLTSTAPATRLVEGSAFVRDPAYSPDGGRVAFIASENGKRELRVREARTGATRTLFTTGGAAWPLYPSWSPDGREIVFQHTQLLGAPFGIVVVDVASGRTREIARTVGSWVARPHFSGDGRWVYFTNRPGKIAGLYRIRPQPNAVPELLTDLSRHVHEGLVSPDGRWMAFRRNSEIWMAPFDATPVRDAALRRLSEEGGRSFAFAPDSTAIVFAAGGKVWRQPVAGGTRTEVPVRVSLPRAVAPPLLVTRARVLDLNAGAFTPETSMLVEAGRISWIGSEQGRTLPAGTVRLDAAGRFAVPGLFDTHVHSAWANQQANEDAFIAFGVTSVRDTGGSLDLLTALDDRSDLTNLPAPRYFYSGEIFEGMMPHWGDAFYTIGSEDEVRAEVRNLKAWGADFVKVYPSLPYHLQAVMAEEAHRVGLPIVGHGLSADEIIRRVLWGSTSVEHAGTVLGTYGDVQQLLAQSGTAADLTLSVGGGALMRASDPEWQSNWRVLEYVPAEARLAGQGGGGPNALGRADQSRPELLELFAPRFERLRGARRLGVPTTGGTDSLMGGVFFGLSLHWELAQFADAGYAPIDVLRMATMGGATLVGADRDLGSLEAGKLADVLLLDADPLADVRNTQRIWRVIKGGWRYDPAALRPGVAAAAAQ